MSALHASIAVFPAVELVSRHEALCGLLADAVDRNASVGYVWPHDSAHYAAAWNEWIEEVACGRRDVLLALVAADVAGCVHVVPCAKPNQPHRADIAKLLVHRRHAGRGLGRALMHAAERQALARGRTLLTLDTRTGSAAETLYRSEGWTTLGIVPGYALDPDGTPGDCTFFWKRLAGSAPSRA